MLGDFAGFLGLFAIVIVVQAGLVWIVLALGRRWPPVTPVAAGVLFVHYLIAYQEVSGGLGALGAMFDKNIAVQRIVYPVVALMWLGIAIWGSLKVIQKTQRSTAPAIASDEVLTNTGVIAMINAGLGEELVFEKIKYSRCSFALSSTDLTALKQEGVSDRVLSMMLENQARRGRAPEYDRGPDREVRQTTNNDGSEDVLDAMDSEVVPSQVTNFCYHCGSELPDNAVECRSCGKAV